MLYKLEFIQSEWVNYSIYLWLISIRIKYNGVFFFDYHWTACDYWKKKKKEDPTSLWASVIFQGVFSEDQNPGHQHCAKVDLWLFIDATCVFSPQWLLVGFMILYSYYWVHLRHFAVTWCLSMFILFFHGYFNN